MFAAIGNDLLAVYGVGETADEAIDDARCESGDPLAEFSAVPITNAALAYVRGPGGGAPNSELIVTRRGVSLRSEEP